MFMPTLSSNYDCKIRRKYKNEQKLIIGCGNSPQMLDKEYQDEHVHDGYYTYDVNEKMNPSCLTDIKNHSFHYIPSNTIKEIIFEGVYLPYNKCGHLLQEIERIKTKDALIRLEIKSIGTYRNNEGQWENYYGDEPFIDYNELHIHNCVIGKGMHCKKDLETCTEMGTLVIYYRTYENEYFTKAEAIIKNVLAKLEINLSGYYAVYVKTTDGHYFLL